MKNPAGRMHVFDMFVQHLMAAAPDVMGWTAPAPREVCKMRLSEAMCGRPLKRPGFSGGSYL